MLVRTIAATFFAIAAASLAQGADPEGDYIAGLVHDAPHLRELLADYPGMRDFLVQDRWRQIELHGDFLPGGRWRVHDIRRPQPALVTVPSEELGVSLPPSDAVVLFDGNDLAQWQGESLDKWSVEHGVLIASGTEDNLLATRQQFGDVQVHVEWAAPDPPGGEWQYRGNSGVFLQGLYEVQILDSWKNPVFPDGQAGAIFGQQPPLVNPARPPGAWQSFDILFEAPKFDGRRLKNPAYITLLYNGVLVHHHQQIIGATDFGRRATYTAHPAAGPLMLQDHGDPASRVRFRNIWARAITGNLP